MVLSDKTYIISQNYGSRTIETPPGSEGVVVTYRRGRSKRIYVRGYYDVRGYDDSMGGLVGLDLTLRDFCEALGITAQEVAAALADPDMPCACRS